MQHAKLSRAIMICTIFAALAINPHLAFIKKAWAVANYNVTIQNESFTPSSQTVRIGDNVAWRNMDPLQYELFFQYSNGNTALSPFLKQGDTYTLSFAKCGTIQYVTVASP